TPGGTRALHYSADGKTLLLTNAKGQIEQLEVGTGKQLRLVAAPTKWQINGGYFSRDGTTLLRWDLFDPIDVVDVATGKILLQHKPAGASGPLFLCCALAADGKSFLVSHAGSTVQRLEI